MRRSKWICWTTEPYHEVILERKDWALLRGPDRPDFYPAMISHLCIRESGSPIIRMNNGEHPSCPYCKALCPGEIQILWDFMCADHYNPKLHAKLRYGT